MFDCLFNQGTDAWEGMLETTEPKTWIVDRCKVKTECICVALVSNIHTYQQQSSTAFYYGILCQGNLFVFTSLLQKIIQHNVL